MLRGGDTGWYAYGVRTVLRLRGKLPCASSTYSTEAPGSTCVSLGRHPACTRRRPSGSWAGCRPTCLSASPRAPSPRQYPYRCRRRPRGRSSQALLGSSRRSRAASRRTTGRNPRGPCRSGRSSSRRPRRGARGRARSRRSRPQRRARSRGGRRCRRTASRHRPTRVAPARGGKDPPPGTQQQLQRRTAAAACPARRCGGGGDEPARSLNEVPFTISYTTVRLSFVVRKLRGKRGAL